MWLWQLQARERDDRPKQGTRFLHETVRNWLPRWCCYRVVTEAFGVNFPTFLSSFPIMWKLALDHHSLARPWKCSKVKDKKNYISNFEARFSKVKFNEILGIVSNYLKIINFKRGKNASAFPGPPSKVLDHKWFYATGCLSCDSFSFNLPMVAKYS